jgi:hypothetical protein
MNGFTNQQIISSLVTVLIMSYAAFFVWIVASIRDLRSELHSRIDRLDKKFSRKIESPIIAVSRLERCGLFLLRRSAVPQPVRSHETVGDIVLLASR